MEIANIADNEMDYPEDSFFYKVGVTEIFNLDLSPKEFKILMFIFNKTVGFKKKWDFIAKYIFENEMQSSRHPTDKVLKTLEDRNFIEVYRNPQNRKKNTTAKYNAYKITDKLLENILYTYEEALKEYN